MTFSEMFTSLSNGPPNNSISDQLLNDQQRELNAASYEANQKKRTRATPEQLLILEETFQQNTSPNAKLREILSEKLSMTERSIQIWFQNRRAKVKLLQKRAVNNNTLNHHQRNYLHQNSATSPYNPSNGFNRSNPIDFNHFQVPQKPPNTIVSNTLLLSNETLSIGTWRRVALCNDDLLCTISLADSIIRWQIVESANKFKLEFPITAITSITLDPVTDHSNKPNGGGQLSVFLSKAPIFFMEINNGQGNVWTQCRDFTEGHQATKNFQHILQGNFNNLHAELMNLMQFDQYFNHITHINTPNTLAVGSLNSLKRPSLSNTSSLDDLNQFSFPRRGSCPTSFFDSPSFKLRRGSVLDHSPSSNPSPLLEATSVDFDSPLLGSPLALPLQLYPQVNNFHFNNGTASASPNLYSEFNQLNVLEDLNFNQNAFTGTSNNVNNSFMGNLMNNGSQQNDLILNEGVNFVADQKLREKNREENQNPKQVDGVNSAPPVEDTNNSSDGKNSSAQNTDFLFDIAQFLDSTSSSSDIGFNDNLISV
ncbi:hypothetical protein HK099_008046 [Clydaea vesicula]|uniref:Homeobox domain-containing protein n=1 Tax=Clydaea vesicula TaxID=447962 RepID=A0AAD5XTC8_9FUNG|nr:hypothetical protein HK099_008046 [Clydaea vesicula]